jgi:glycosyltransferase involved in cell wall biosynthesis
MKTRTLRILSNFRGLDAHPPPGIRVVHQCVGNHPGLLGTVRILLALFRYDAILLDGNPPYLLLLCLVRWLCPLSDCRLISVDIMMVKPVTRMQRFKARVYRLLLKRVDHFIHYFKDLEGYTRYFGISPQRSTFVPFKINFWERMPPAGELSADGEYVFTGGRSLRDLDTFIEAMRRVPFPGILLFHDLACMRENGTPLSLENLPANLRAVEDDGSAESWLGHLRKAKLVVITTLPSSIRAIGVSTYLTAMGLKKCVLITDGPGTRHVLGEEALRVPPADPASLADVIRRAWDDDALREATAAAGRKYAEKLAGTTRLYADFLEVCARVAGTGERGA